MEDELSDGELCELSDISSDLDFFESLKKKMDRKLELEFKSRKLKGGKFDFSCFYLLFLLF